MNCTYCNAESGNEEICNYCHDLWIECDDAIDKAEKAYNVARKNAYNIRKQKLNTRKHFISMGIDEHGTYKVSESILVRIHYNWRKFYNLTDDTLFTVIGYSVDGVNLSTQSDTAFSVRITVDDIPHVQRVTTPFKKQKKKGD